MRSGLVARTVAAALDQRQQIYRFDRSGTNCKNRFVPEFLVGELVRQRMGALSASERRLAQVLLAFYPVAGLESLTRFAERAGVSPATVTRFIAKLGLRGYPEFQDSLRQELQERLSSPLTRYELTPARRIRAGRCSSDAFATYEHSLRASVDMVSEHDFDAVIELLGRSAPARAGARRDA